MRMLKNALIISLSVSLFAIILTITADLLEWYTLGSYPPAETLDAIDVDLGVQLTVDVFILLSTLFMFLTLVVTAVLFLIWVFQLHKRTRLMESKDSIYHPGLVLAIYFVPFVSLVMPPVAMWQINRAQVKRLKVHTLNSWIIAWWLFFLLVWAISTVFMDFDTNWETMTIGEIRSNALVYALGEFSLLIAGVALLRIIHLMTKRLFEMEKAYSDDNTKRYAAE
ncbi:DUF4328 domain-containing protein [Salicibibacter cibi]|uniref:DUF4328 domain-containing protein n=1 Tax=Salicibibacter cibi TaxID=2743001 RepID=A0A7T6ZDA4_9BACI|nr:DUF4328 domain-containing protein [Salicibibacter cibi]QQK81384.1 DUF4328 domain-containing protein [Salicibibacter cibi]